MWKPSRLESAVVKLGLCAFPPQGAACASGTAIGGLPLSVSLLPQLGAGRGAEGSTPWVRAREEGPSSATVA